MYGPAQTSDQLIEDVCDFDLEGYLDNRYNCSSSSSLSSLVSNDFDDP